MRAVSASTVLAPGIVALLASQAFVGSKSVTLPSAKQVGRALAIESACPGPDSHPDVLCDPRQPDSATFRQLLCVEYGSDAERHPIVRCVYKGGRMTYRDQPRAQIGDGAIDVIYIHGTWLPN